MSTKQVQPINKSTINDVQTTLAPKDDEVEASVSGTSRTNDESNDNNNRNTSPEGLATVREVFAFADTFQVKIYIVLGSIAAILSGICFPAMAWLFSNSFSELSASPSGDEFLQQIRYLVYKFMVLGCVMFIAMTVQATFLEAAATEMTQSLKRQWFQSLLRQDMTYYDITDVSGTATIISTNGMKFQNGVGHKFSEGIQFTFVCIGGLAYGFWSSWKVSLLILSIVPFMVLSSKFLLKMNRTQTARANESYSKAGAIVYSTVTSIRTVLSLNAVETIIEKFAAATEEAYQGASSQMTLLGIANGSVMGSFLLAYFPLILYGSYLLYEEIRVSGCDPSGAVPENIECDPSAANVFGALMGITFGGATLPQVATAVEAFVGARSAAYPAMVAICRRTAKTEEEIEQIEEESEAIQRRASTSVLPKYKIDSSSSNGIVPNAILGSISFKDVTFAYPTRQEVNVFDKFSLDIKAGHTVAIVGKSGCGKSTVLSMIERFYDPLEGTISIDGTDIKRLNVKWLRKQIGVVSQEPKLFATSICENIRTGHPRATQEEVEEAAKKANAHDFIMKFPDGYETNVGHEGTKLSGGQKQRIAIARILIHQPQIIVLDEATSSLDSESESVVQEALDKIIKEGHQTIIVIAHRLSTIKNADKIVVVGKGRVVEEGTHSELIRNKHEYYELVEAQRGHHKDGITKDNVVDNKPSLPTTTQIKTSRGLTSTSSSSFEDEVTGLDTECREDSVISFVDVHFHYPTRPNAMIFRGLNLDVKEGETLGIVGPSGQGKSTIVQLIENFYYPTKGTLHYRGVDMKELNVRWLRNQLSLVSQEPVLFNTTIEENIRFGLPEATHEQVEAAARQANAHDFIMSFPDHYNTAVGSGSTKISGGQKQRIAIARAIIRKPKLLLLDEATSSLDSESEGLVQDALDRIMSDKNQTTIVIAHRLSTIRRADRIAVINKGRVAEIGTHGELMALPSGKYKHLQELQDLGVEQTQGKGHIPPLLTKHSTVLEERYSPKTLTAVTISDEKKEASKMTVSKARLFAKGNEWNFAVGSIGALLAGLMFPGWGLVFAYMIELLYNPIFPCDDGVEDCEKYRNDLADDIQQTSFKVGYGLIAIVVAAVIGHTLVWYGFGTASERINKRVRDAAFRSLARQEVGWFDGHSVGDITSQLSDDASKLHAYSGEPIRSLVLTLSSLLVGLVVSLLYMWPFSLVALATLPLMAFAAKAKMEMFMGKDEGVYDSSKDKENSSGGIVIETLSNIRTVASLTLEDLRLSAYSRALQNESTKGVIQHALSQCSMGLGQLVRTWAIGFYFWWGGWLLNNYPGTYDFHAYLVSMFSLLFSISGMSVAMQGLTDRDEAAAAAGRIFELLERESEIDPLSDEGVRL